MYIRFVVVVSSHCMNRSFFFAFVLVVSVGHAWNLLSENGNSVCMLYAVLCAWTKYDKYIRISHVQCGWDSSIFILCSFFLLLEFDERNGMTSFARYMRLSCNAVLHSLEMRKWKSEFIVFEIWRAPHSKRWTVDANWCLSVEFGALDSRDSHFMHTYRERAIHRHYWRQ